MIVTLTPIRNRRSRGMGSVLPLSLAQAASSPDQAAAPATPNCPWWYIFTGNYLACMQQPQLQADMNAQIQTVADNAAKYYGPDSTTAAVARAAVAAQIAQTPYDVAAVTSQIENSQVGQSPVTWAGNALLNPNVVNDNSSPWGVPWWVWAIAVGGGVFLIARR